MIKELKFFPSYPHAKIDLRCTCKGTVNDDQLNIKRAVTSNNILGATIIAKVA